MRTIFAEYNPQRNSVDVYTSASYMLRIDCWEAEKNLKTTPGSDCALNALAIDEPLEYVRLLPLLLSRCTEQSAENFREQSLHVSFSGNNTDTLAGDSVHQYREVSSLHIRGIYRFF